MANITTSSPTFYSNGNSGASTVAGYEGGRTRVVRYSFTAPPEGATQIGFWTNGVYRGDSDCMATSLSARITTSASDCPSIGTASQGTLNYSSNVVSGYVSCTLMPSTTYYLWIYPSNRTYGYWIWPSSAQNISTQGSTAAVTPSISPASLSIGDGEFIISAQPPVSGYTCKLSFKIGDVSFLPTEQTTYTSPDTKMAVSYDGLINAFRLATNGKSATLTVTCQTYTNSGKLVGTKQATATVSMPSSDSNWYRMYFQPTVSLSAESITENSVVKGWEAKGAYVANYSKIKLTAGYSQHADDTQASLNYYWLSCGEGNAWSGTSLSSDYSFTLTKAGSAVPDLIIRDSRGSSERAWAQGYQVYGYSLPAFRISESGRCHSEKAGIIEDEKTYTPAANGTKAYIKLDAVTFSDVGGNNVCTATVLCNGSNVGSFPIDGSTKNYEYIVSIDGGLDLNEKYQITVTLADSLNSATVNTEIQKRSVGLHLKKGGLGAAVGKYAEEDGLFDIGFKTRFCNGIEPMKIDGSKSIDDCVLPNIYVGNNSAYNGDFMLEVLPIGANDIGVLQRIYYYADGMLISKERTKPKGKEWSNWYGVIENDGAYNYVRQPDGKAECWYTYRINDMDCSAVIGGFSSDSYKWYRTDKIELERFPLITFGNRQRGLFSSTPTVNVNYNSANQVGAFAWNFTGKSEISPGTIYLIRPNATGQLTGDIEIHAIGTWK